MAGSQSKFNSGSDPVFSGGKKLIAEGISKAKGASRTPFGKRKAPKGKA